MTLLRLPTARGVTHTYGTPGTRLWAASASWNIPFVGDPYRANKATMPYFALSGAAG
jgi:hypothetical protein